MPDVTIYTTAFCPYCLRAKALLDQKNVAFTEIDVSYDPDERQRMSVRAQGNRKVPQIFVGDTHIGGYEELSALEHRGSLDSLLAT